MYKSLIEESVKKIEKVCEDIITYLEGNQDEIELIRMRIKGMESELHKRKHPTYYATYSNTYHLSEDLRPWHNVPREILDNLEKEVKELGDNIIIARPDLKNPISELQEKRRIRNGRAWKI